MIVRPILKPDQVKAIHDGAIRLLWETGMRVDDPEARTLLADAGADVDRNTGRVRVSERLVTDALATSPCLVRLADRRGSQLELAAESDRHYHATADNKMEVADLATGKIRRSTEQDVASLVRLADALPNIDFILPMAAANDAGDALNPLLTAQAVFLNTTKHVLASPVSLREAVIFTEIGRLLCQGGDLRTSPVVSGVAATTSPLVFDAESAAMAVHFARAGCPLFTCSAPLVGAASPITLAGVLVLENAEVLFTLVLAQAARRGTPVVYWVSPVLLDMRTAKVTPGRVEQFLLNRAASQLAAYYGLPYGAPLGTSDRRRDPLFTGAIRMASYMAALAGGWQVSLGAGYLRPMIVDPVQLVIDDDLLGVARQLRREIIVDEETLAIDLMQQLGPGAAFMSERHTVDWLRRGEHFFASLAYDLRTEREGKGRPALADLAREKALHILAAHQPAIPEDAASLVREYVSEQAQAMAQANR
jgi:trimethylamine--corrinoid protein Co-methyltransferase